jgi:hypothetical protein
MDVKAAGTSGWLCGQLTPRPRIKGVQLLLQYVVLRHRDNSLYLYPLLHMLLFFFIYSLMA